MKNHLPKAIILLGLFISALLGINITNNVSADGYGFRVTPASEEITLHPGETYSGTMHIANLGDNETDFQMVVYPYSVAEDGTTSIEDESDYTLIKDWITFSPASGKISKDEVINVNYIIDVPKDIPGGGQYAALAVEGVNNSKLGSLSTGISVSTVLYANLEGGATRREGNVLSQDINGFLFNPPISVSSTIENTGNIHFEAEYIMRVYPFFGGESIFNNEENPETKIILPNSKRYNSVSWTADQGAPSIGIYKVQSEVKYLDKTSSIEKMVIVCPMWVLILILVFILAVIFWLVSRSKARKQ